jgi:hypothetical protein
MKEKHRAIMLPAVIAHHTPVITLSNGTACINMGFSVDQWLLFYEYIHPLR